MSGGQEALAPVHFSTRSQAAAAARQTVVAGASASAGQVGPAPVQVSARSHRSVAGRQIWDGGAKPSAGHVRAVHFSDTSQAPSAARHSTPLQSESAQSALPSQSSSMPLAQSVSGPVDAQLHVSPTH